VVSRLGTLVIGVALARVLGPDEFGIFAIAMVTLLAILSFNELGVSLAVIRWRDDPRTIAPTINTIAVISSAILTAATWLLAPSIATILGDVRATGVIQVLGLSIFVNGLVATPAAVLQREFMQKERTIADQVNTWLGAGLSLLFALLGWGAMSLAAGRLIASIVFALLIWHWSPVPYRFGWDRTTAGRLLRFGLPLAVSSIVVFASGYVDQVIVASSLDARALGFYVLAFNLASWPVSIFSQPLRAVAPATFSALKDDPARMTRNFVRILGILSAVAIPACLAISGAAGPVVRFVYGAQWAPAADVLLWLAAFATLRIWFELAYDYLVVHGRSGLVLVVQSATFVVALPVMLLIVRPLGEAGVAAAQLVVGLAVGVPLYLLSLRSVDVRVGAVARGVVLPTLAGLIVWVAAAALARMVEPAFFAAAASALVSVAVIAALALTQRANLRLLRTALANRGTS
jgi:PST family polysaccharide transporter